MDEPLYVLWLGFRGGALLFWLEWFIWVNLVKWPMQIVKHIHYFLLLYVWINKNHKAVKQCWIVLCDCSTVYVKSSLCSHHSGPKFYTRLDFETGERAIVNFYALKTRGYCVCPVCHFVQNFNLPKNWYLAKW